MLLRNLGFNEAIADDVSVAILVGPNGSGKSIHLRKIVDAYRKDRTITIISNTAYGRLNNLRIRNRFTVGRNGPSPKAAIKFAVASTLDKDSSEFYQISSILEYCRYRPRFGFSLDIGTDNAKNSNDIDDDLVSLRQSSSDFRSAEEFIERWPSGELMWIDSSAPVHKFSINREFAAVLRNESALTRTKVLKGIRVYLEKNDGSVFELESASSGELSLISSLVFLTTTVKDNSIVLIDEPENSLHPSWQREYVSKVIGALGYRNASIVIATHSPLVVTGATTEHQNLVTVYQMKNGLPEELSLNDHKHGETGIEEILWKAFEVVTPANHFVSEELVDAIGQFEQGEIQKAEVTTLINRMDAKSFDRKQGEFFTAVRNLVDKVEARKNTPPEGNSKND